MKRRLSLIVGEIILIIISGGVAIIWLNDNCPNLDQENCQFMWGTWVAAIMGGILLTEYLYARQRIQKESHSPTQTASKDMTDNSNWYVTIRPIAWVTLSALLISMPLFVQGAFVLTLFGVMSGVFFNLLIRTIFNWLPPVDT